MTVLKELNLDDKIDLISISKNDKHKSETIHLTNGKEIKIGQNRELFYLSRIQDEVHRFTVGFHRKQKSKKMIN
jgi:excinuclease ABC subunit C